MSQQQVETAAPPRRRDAGRTRRDILAIATREFSERGYDGARVDEIAAQMQTTKRMIYYYFGSKEQLYVEVLKAAYAGIRAAEIELHVDADDPVAAIRRLAEFTFDYHESNPDFIRLVSIENIHRAGHMAKAGIFADLNSPIRELIERVLERGRAAGVFKRDVDAIDVHMIISAFCVFRVANRHTFGVSFGRDLADASRREHYRAMLGDMVVDYLLSPGPVPGPAA